MLSSKDWNYHHYQEVESTMDVARDLLSEADDRPLVVVADRQTKGRGRRGNTWLNTDGALMMTAALKVEESLDISAFPLVVASSLIKVIDPEFNRLLLKWPNDILDHSYRKIAGILIEAVKVKQQKFLLVGLGINLKSKTEFYSSVYEATGRQFTLEQLLADVLEQICRDYNLFKEQGFICFKSDWDKSGLLAGTTISAKILGKKKEVIYLGITDQGELIIKDAEKQQILSSTEIYEIKYASS